MNTKRISHLTSTALMAAMLAAGTGYAIANPAGQQTEPAETVNDAESSQPMGDTWITTKVKSQLLADDLTKGTEIDVDTLNGVVHMSGALGSQAEIDKAVEIARSTEGVTDVDTSDLTISGAGATK
ncbi:BON domain-containing protein [Lysobacter sp. SG-8]|uniref:BON domain-containing protein n=1 Tax=Marilutibacter penaei TaxID=2759900 RepID=A0A7W3YEQ9_9GAMM|nr:BON domain-containing protein [Lysobacter penaei]MBB1088456.1 BON domain-containing protein [Lysobacter penaei]